MTDRRFWKMSGSGNDFVFLDARGDPHPELRSPDAIGRVCDRRQGVGADGVVFLEPREGAAAFRMAYFNADGTRASMCGNAALCSTRLATVLGAAPRDGFVFAADTGTVAARIAEDGRPEVELAPVAELRPEVREIERAGGEERIGFALAGVPHVVVLCADAELVDVAGRGAVLRRHAALGAPGANANFVARGPDGRWRMRTFERGVEGETLACGTGAVATAALLGAWGLAARDRVALVTRSGRELVVGFAERDGHALAPSLRGDARIVFEGTLGEIG